MTEKTDIFDDLSLLRTKGDVQQALDRLYDARKRMIKAPFDSDLNLAWYIVGDIHYRRLDFKKALGAFHEALNNRPEDADCYDALGNTHTNLEEYRDAERYYKKALKLTPDDQAFIFNLGNSLLDQNKFSEAARVFKSIDLTKSEFALEVAEHIEFAVTKARPRKSSQSGKRTSETKVRNVIKAATNEGLIRIYREELENGWADGYVAAAGEEFFALELIDDSIRLNGFNCMRYSDITRCDFPAPPAGFLTKALKAQGFCRQEKFLPNLSTLSSLLSTAGAVFPLLTIHLEVSDPDICFIGKVESVTSDQLDLKLITPDGEWKVSTKQIALDGITRVDFGGAYEAALFLIASNS